MKNEKSLISSILKLADVELDGSRPWDINVHNQKFYKRLLSDGALGLGPEIDWLVVFHYLISR